MTDYSKSDAAKLALLCGQYAGHLEKLGIRSRVPGGEEDEVRTATGWRLENKALPHIAWMAHTAGRMEPDSIHKAMRWLGFIQGVLWCFGLFSIDDLRRHWNEGRVGPEGKNDPR